MPNNDDLKLRFQCAKCKNSACETGEIRAAGGFWTKLFNIQSQRFSTFTCNQCGFTEVYKRKTKTGENVLDFFVN